MNLFLTCQDVLRFIPDYEDNLLSTSLRLRLSVHLKACKPCLEMLESLRVLPRILRSALSDESSNNERQSPSPEAKKALDAVLARLQAGGRLAQGTHPGSLYQHRSAHPIPDFVSQALVAGTADRPMRLMAEAYQAIQEHGGALATEPFLPDSILKELPRLDQWKWTKTLLNGCSSAFLSKDPDTGASLHMILLPPGRTFPDHRHRGDEHALLLAGRAETDRYYGTAGDWFHQMSGTEHRALQGRGQDTCWALGRLEGPGVHLLGWRGVLQSIAERS